MNVCSYVHSKQQLTLPLKRSPDKSPGTEQSACLPPLLPNGRKFSRCKSNGGAASQVPGNAIPYSTPVNPTSADSITFSLLYCSLAAYFPLSGSNLPSHSQSLAIFWLTPSPEASLTHLHLDNYNSSLFNFNFYWFFEALISEMYGIIGLYRLAIYLYLSLYAGLILFSTESQKKMLPLLLFGYHNSSRSPELRGSAAPRNFVLRWFGD